MIYRSTRAQRDEHVGGLPGDDLLHPCTSSFTHTVTIRRPRHEVWPWLLQMGAGRAGWYRYDFIDNGRKPSAERVIPELQHVNVGAIMPWLPGATEGFTVLSVEPERCLILCAVSPSDGHLVMTWAFVLEEPEPGISFDRAWTRRNGLLSAVWIARVDNENAGEMGTQRHAAQAAPRHRATS